MYCNFGSPHVASVILGFNNKAHNESADNLNTARDIPAIHNIFCQICTALALKLLLPSFQSNSDIAIRYKDQYCGSHDVFGYFFTAQI